MVQVARERGVAQGRKLKTDTTCVESNLPYPTDSSLLGDGVRVLSRCLARMATPGQSGAGKVVPPARTVQYGLLEISRAAQSLTPLNQRKRKKSYQQLVALTRQVVRPAGKVRKRWPQGQLPVIDGLWSVTTQMARLQHCVPLVEKVIQQTPPRVLRGNRRVSGKIVSLFESPSPVIGKGKAHQPNELGRLVRVEEVENGIVSRSQVLEGNPADTGSFLPAVKQPQSGFGRTPETATAERGFFSAQKEREANKLGVKKVALPARGRLARQRAQPQKQRWFRRAWRWRAGMERTLSHLQHPFSRARARYKGDRGFQRPGGWSVIAQKLFSSARWQERRNPEPRKKNESVEGVLRPAAQATR